jgi:hypothetical protein
MEKNLCDLWSVKDFLTQHLKHKWQKEKKKKVIM